MHKFLPVFLIIIGVIFISSYLPAKRFLVYKLGISGDPTTSCCSEEEILSSSGDFNESANLAIFNNQTIDYPKTSLAHDNLFKLLDRVRLAASLAEDGQQVLGTQNAAGEEKWIEVSLDQQKLRAWEGDRIIMEFLISSGKWYPTPKGDFRIWYKTHHQTMKGGSKELGTYYNLPNVPNNMFFYKGFAIHGAYWHNNFGQPMSHGCVNSPLPNAAELFEWSGPVLSPGQNAVRATANNPGTRVFVH